MISFLWDTLPKSRPHFDFMVENKNWRTCDCQEFIWPRNGKFRSWTETAKNPNGESSLLALQVVDFKYLWSMRSSIHQSDSIPPIWKQGERKTSMNGWPKRAELKCLFPIHFTSMQLSHVWRSSTTTKRGQSPPYPMQFGPDKAAFGSRWRLRICRGKENKWDTWKNPWIGQVSHWRGLSRRTPRVCC